MFSRSNIEECELWVEVIKTAMRDVGFYFKKDGEVIYIKPAFKPARKHQKDKHSLRKINFCQGVRFLTANSGAWKQSREAVCEMAMICPDGLRERCLKMMSEQRNSQKLIA